jgi:hypothetical protein
MHSMSPSSSNMPARSPLPMDGIVAEEANGGIRFQDHAIPTVLIVEDNDVVSDFLQSACLVYGFRALAATTPEQAVEHCRRERNGIQDLVRSGRLPEKLGGSVFLQKPFLPSDILSVLKCLRRPS